jgi:hypothetical protein
MKQATAPMLHLQNPIDQISVACLIRKCQGSLQPIPLQLGPEFGFPERDHTGMQVHASGQRDEVPCVDSYHHLIVGEGVGKHSGIVSASEPNVHSSLGRNT